MESVFVLGPGVDSYTEPTNADPAIQVRVTLLSPPILPGGKLRFHYTIPTGATLFPKVHIVTVPIAELPPEEEQTAEFFMSGNYPIVTVERGTTTKPTYEATLPTIPGETYAIRTVLEYPPIV